jgi:hypothetical protein
MKTLLTGMPYKPSTEKQCVQETWRKYGWKPTGETDSDDDETVQEIEQSLEYFNRYIAGDR